LGAISSILPVNHPNLIKCLGVSKNVSYITMISEYFDDAVPMFFF